MKKILIITTILLTLGFFSPNPVFAVTNCSSVNNPQICPSLNLNDDMVLRAQAFDENGYPLVFTNIRFVWTITGPAANPSSLGSFTSANGATCTGGEITSSIRCAETENNIDGSSTVNLHASSISVNGGEVAVSMTVGSATTVKRFNINTACTSNPHLYYGIASVKDDNNTWQSSTAEVLETCHPEYKLYDGIGAGQ